MRSPNAAEMPSCYFRLGMEEALSCVPVLYALADTLVLSHRRHSEVKRDREGQLLSRSFIVLSLSALVCAFPFKDPVSLIVRYI